MLEGPRVIAGALDRGVVLEHAYLGLLAERAFAPLVARLVAAGTPLAELKEGVLEKVADARTPQPVLAVAPVHSVSLDDLPVDGLVIVAVTVRDPGNAGALLRSAEAAGAAGVVFVDSTDPYGPKAVRASAGAIFGVRVVEADDPVQVLEALGAQGRRRVGTLARGGLAPDEVDLTQPVAIVLGSEGAAESLNVAMAGAVLAFEAARQRRAAGR